MPLPPRRALAALGALQGLALWALTDNWPEEAPRLRALFTGAVFWIVASALVLHMARTEGQRLRLVLLAAAVGLVFGAVALWVAWQLPGGDVPFQGDDGRVTSWVVASAIALYVLGPFLQVYQETGRLRFPYPDLYRHSWNNFFIASLGGLFALALWLVLVLWFQLFKLVEIDFFEELFTEPLFLFPVMGASVAYGLAVGKENDSIISTLRGLTQSLLRALLPLLAAVTLAFLATLPFTGLAPLFATRSAASVLIGWLAAFVLVLNAVYLDGSQPPPYGAPLRRLGEAGTLALPVMGAIGIYAVVLRVQQYGLTPDRIFAGVLALVLTLYAVGYAVAAALRGEPWLPALRHVNVAMAGVVIALALGLHTPLLDPLAWSVRDQVARVRSSAIPAAEFDFAHLRFKLGHRGFAALEELAADPPAPEDAARERIDLALRVESYWEWQREGALVTGLLDRIRREPDGAPWPEGLEPALRRAAAYDFRIGSCRGDTPCVLRDADLDGDGSAEALLGIGWPQSFSILVFARSGAGDFQLVGRLEPDPGLSTPEQKETWLDAFRRGDLRPAPPPYPDLRLGDLHLRMHPDQDPRR